MTKGSHLRCIDPRLLAHAHGPEPLFEDAPEGVGDAADAHELVAENTIVAFDGWQKHIYKTPALLTSIALAWKLADVHHVKDAVRLAWQLTLSPRICKQLDLALDEGRLQIPRRSLILCTMTRLDMTYSLWQQRLCSERRGMRSLMADSSEQAGFNFLGGIETRILWPKTENPSQVYEQKGFAGLCSFLQRHWSRHYLPLSCMGYGLADTTAKASKLNSAVKLETGSEHNYDAFRMQMRVFSSDQGVESGIADDGSHCVEGV